MNQEKEYTGGPVSYYMVAIDHPTRPETKPYMVEANDIIEALGMNFAEGNAFKAIWRACAARKGLSKRGYDDGLYDAEKVVYYGQRMVEQAKQHQAENVRVQQELSDQLDREFLTNSHQTAVKKSREVIKQTNGQINGDSL